MRYIEVIFSCEPNIDYIIDIFSDELAGIGFESFVHTTNGLIGYIPENIFSVAKIDFLIANVWFDATIDYRFNIIEDRNWNEEWEKHFFEPIVIDTTCIVHSSFHQIAEDYPYRIVIDPKMAFGTGHHQTTHLMLQAILAMNIEGKTVLDMGCGTAVLAILASMRGAKSVQAIDIEEWAYRNALENVALNNVANVNVLHGDADLLGKQQFDVILANINRNILLHDIPRYHEVLNNGGKLIMSGFYKEDIPKIRSKCEALGLIFEDFREREDWVAVSCYLP